jgi:hypothetical protein
MVEILWVKLYQGLLSLGPEDHSASCVAIQGADEKVRGSRPKPCNGFPDISCPGSRVLAGFPGGERLFFLWRLWAAVMDDDTSPRSQVGKAVSDVGQSLRKSVKPVDKGHVDSLAKYLTGELCEEPVTGCLNILAMSGQPMAQNGWILWVDADDRGTINREEAFPGRHADLQVSRCAQPVDDLLDDLIPLCFLTVVT